MSKFKQGRYVLKRPEKYMGDIHKVIYRSSWELNLHKFFDGNANIIRWGSEVLRVPYVKPTDGRVHNYFVDYYIEYVNKTGELMKEAIEVKPASQTRAPKGRTANLYETLQYEVNVAKWKACQVWCAAHGVKFRIVTEHEIFK
jgi:hypothetical protein